MKYIYARVSTKNQNLQTQLDLQAAYPDAELISEKVSGVKSVNDRPEFSALDKKLEKGDSVIVYDLSRLGRNTAELLSLVEDWKGRGIGLVVHNLGGQSIDTQTATGYMMFTVLAAVGQMQRDLQREKAQAGMAIAVAEGRMKGGRPHKTKQIEKALKLINENGLTKQEAAKAVGIGVATVYRALKKPKVNPASSLN
ncbi:recombinase family protein [Vibrio tasmaniensis 1F-187]|uniref:recombinase family protein n=1 Tax=unclassified Vibrio TaxID=2614977 RepID=UPI000308F8DD|nr:recombinase family protein [Vibrio tasmaniensis]OEF72317.1 resolvase [Vibrio tasmaniensis 1F-187]